MVEYIADGVGLVMLRHQTPLRFDVPTTLCRVAIDTAIWENTIRVAGTGQILLLPRVPSSSYNPYILVGLPKELKHGLLVRIGVALWLSSLSFEVL